MERKYQEYFSDASMRHAIGKLTMLRGLIQDGPIRDALGTALDCTKYLRAEVYRDRDHITKLEKSADCFVIDHGPLGYFYECSYCGNSHWGRELDLERRGCACGRVLDTVKLEQLDAESLGVDDKLALIRDILTSMSPEELAAVKSKMSK